MNPMTLFEMPVMDGRRTTLQSVSEAWNACHLPLVNLTTGHWGAAGYTDDVGLYYFVPLLSRWVGIAIDPAINLFLWALIFLGASVAAVFFFKMYPGRLARWVVGAGLTCLALQAWRAGDVYVTLMALTSIFAPYFLWTHRRAESESIWDPWMFALLGLLAGYGNLIRSQSGNGVLILMFVGLAVHPRFKPSRKTLLLGLTLVALAVPSLHFKHLERQRDAFLVSQDPTYQPKTVRHPFWHNVYIGFGYLQPNPYGITYSDTVASDKVKSVDPQIGFVTKEYEAVLKDETLKLVRHDPWFTLKTLAAKSAKLFLYLLVYANLGWLYVWKRKLSWRIWLPLLLAAGFFTLPGLLVMPGKAYVLGMISLAALFGIDQVCWRTEQGPGWKPV